MTYDARLAHLLHKIDEDRAHAARLITLLTDVSDSPGRLPGGRAPGVPGESPTESVALDEARMGIVDALDTAYPQLVDVAARLAGVVAQMDRALSLWEGQPGEAGRLHG